MDYGPLTELIGTRKGDKGLDVAPEPDGTENNPYYETIKFTPIGDVENAETQVLAAVHYRQIVKRKSNDKVFHDETGYRMWDAAAGILMHFLTIPRAVSVLVGDLELQFIGRSGPLARPHTSIGYRASIPLIARERCQNIRLITAAAR